MGATNAEFPYQNLIARAPKAPCQDAGEWGKGSGGHWVSSSPQTPRPCPHPLLLLHRHPLHLPQHVPSFSSHPGPGHKKNRPSTKRTVLLRIQGLFIFFFGQYRFRTQHHERGRGGGIEPRRGRMGVMSNSLNMHMASSLMVLSVEILSQLVS